jgi:hypothetical protein
MMNFDDQTVELGDWGLAAGGGWGYWEIHCEGTWVAMKAA